MAKRRNFSAAFKAKVALEALRGDQTLAELPAGLMVLSLSVMSLLPVLRSRFRTTLKSQHRTDPSRYRPDRATYRRKLPRERFSSLGLKWTSPLATPVNESMT